MKILLVEDDDRIARPIIEDLRQQKHTVDYARDGVEGWEFTQAIAYDLILLDVMLPRLDGISLCRRLRSHHATVHILMITARDTTSDKVLGLDAGADDYLVKPFDLEELSARVRALARRSSNFIPNLLTHGELQIDCNRQTVQYGGRTLTLTPKEFMLLECLLRNPAQVFTRTMLLDKLWEVEQLSGEETIKTHITNLRRKLREAGSPVDLIETVYGVGYRLHAL
ncbi:response regulator transcription factor [Microcystis aeruginosa]|uniref:Two component transcriptional regulator, winged helix family n=1 Tax=Microcystis aeruginosa PCC 9443 TaxID=1160281 RepID=I4G502_MICAE|nr:response regulator transcription factor [Microcystis aeruginosa]CCI03013.1 Two component transcriptional regulator, winged helix family [Microcystis aeruginosa PCC 9443]